MPNFSSADVMRLRQETDAPVLEAKQALTEADGNFDRAKEILREKGKAAAVKRADRATSEGVVAISKSANHKSVGGVVLECETDFVARNEEFIAIAGELAEIFLHNEPGNDPMQVKHGDKSVAQIVEGAVAKIRENIKLTKAVHLHTDANEYATYVHHDHKKGVIIEVNGDAKNAVEVGRAMAIQSVAHPPEYLSREEVPKDYIEKQIEVETKRAIEEGKDEKIARNIAQGRVNKEIMSRVVLLEQPLYKDQNKKVGDYLKEEAKNGGGTINIVRVIRLAVGE